MQYSYKKGFTLLELLVVIAIIGIFSTVVMVSLNSSRAKSRDTHRLVELKQIQTALELYRGSFSQYPLSDGQYAHWANDCDAGRVGFLIPELVTSELLQGLKDPLPCSVHWGYTYGSNGVNYKLISHTEYSLKSLRPFLDPAQDGGPDPCVIDGDDFGHFGIWTEGAVCWKEGQTFLY